MAFVGLGHSPIFRRWDEQPQSCLGALALQAARDALEDCGLDAAGVDGVLSTPGPLGDRWLMRWRFRLSRDGSAIEVIEQLAFADLGPAGIQRLDLLCSGFVPDPA